MDNDEFFYKLEGLSKEMKGKKLAKTLKVTITYSTGDKDDFNVSIAFWANMLLATKNRMKYLYLEDHLITLDHVVKMKYEDLECEPL